MTDDHTHARFQRMEDHLRRLDARVSVLSAVGDEATKKRIVDTFGSDARMVIIFRGVQKGLTQEAIAKALRERGLPGAQQARVSNTFDELEELGFIERSPNGPAVVSQGWESFGLERALKRTLKNQGIADLP